MKIWHKPFIYTLSHVFVGFLSYYYPQLITPILVYQFGQLSLNVRVFPLAMRIEKGNSVEHTVVKLLEYGVGYLLGGAWHQAKFNFA